MIDMTKNNVQDITIEDLPEGVPCLKWKAGLYYKPNNCGYTDTLTEAGLYTREDVIKYCFDKDGKNLGYGVYAMPLWMAIKQGYWSMDKVRAQQSRLEDLADIMSKYNYEELGEEMKDDRTEAQKVYDDFMQAAAGLIGFAKSSPDENGCKALYHWDGFRPKRPQKNGRKNESKVES